MFVSPPPDCPASNWNLQPHSKTMLESPSVCLCVFVPSCETFSVRESSSGLPCLKLEPVATLHNDAGKFLRFPSCLRVFV